jgi:biotin carboxyl carrier protein
MSNYNKFFILCAALTLLAGQAQAFWPFTSAEEKAPEAAATQPAGQPATPAAAAPEVPAAPATAAPAAPVTPPPLTKGKVVETMNSGGYTYVCIEKDGQKRWAAMPPTKVEVGQEVELGGGIEMGNFTSKTLNRSFESIYFCGGLVKLQSEGATGATDTGAGQSAMPHPLPTGKSMPPAHHMMQGDQGTMPPGHPATSAAPSAGQAAAKKIGSAQISGKVVETLDGGGYTYAAVEKDGQRSWVAIPPTKLEVGQEVTFQPGFIMNNFSSKALDRTFEAITFSGGVVPPPAPAAPAPAK